MPLPSPPRPISLCPAPLFLSHSLIWTNDPPNINPKNHTTSNFVTFHAPIYTSFTISELNSTLCEVMNVTWKHVKPPDQCPISLSIWHLIQRMESGFDPFVIPPVWLLRYLLFGSRRTQTPSNFPPTLPYTRECVMNYSPHSNKAFLVGVIWPSWPTYPLQHLVLTWCERNIFSRKSETIIWFRVGGLLIWHLKDFLYQIRMDYKQWVTQHY